jgi:hypothetical protein
LEKLVSVENVMTFSLVGKWLDTYVFVEDAKIA